jgi:polyisoprenoid-binding protein YceI
MQFPVEICSAGKSANIMDTTTHPATITPSELQQIMGTGSIPVIDILPQSAFDERHIPGAMNACEYEMVFLEKIRGLISPPEKPFVIYGQSDRTREAQEALSKLHQAGFKSARRLLGGIESWLREGRAVESAPANPPAARSGTFLLDPGQSVVRWTGSNLFNHHTGTMAFKEGRLVAADGKLVHGTLVIDMRAICCTDLMDPAMNALLIRHLGSADFFDVERFPEAIFTLESLDPIPDADLCEPNYRVGGRLLLRGVERPVQFPALIAGKTDGTQVGQAHLAIDRTEWGVLYGSGKFFARLEDHIVDDLIHLHLKVVAVPNVAGAS